MDQDTKEPAILPVSGFSKYTEVITSVPAPPKKLFIDFHAADNISFK